MPVTSYDQVAYPGVALAQTRPDSLAAIATLHGLDPTLIESCRVLEVGCGDGRNLIPLAGAFANAKFVGMDLAASAVQRGKALADDLALTNVELSQADLMEWSPPAEPFDYIIAHGFYSWVPDFVRERLMAVCQQCLSPHGIAFISYNTLPGGHVRRMLREILLFHIRDAKDHGEQITRSRELLEVLAAAPPGAEGHGEVLRAEAQWVLNRTADFVLFHDDLAPVSEPVTISQFAEHAGRHGLRFLAEADYSEMHDMAFPPPVREALGRFGGDVILREQYRDFVKCRRFRQTLLCRAEAPVTAEPQPERVRKLHLASDCKPGSDKPNLAAGVAEQFASPRGPSVRVDHPLTKAALFEAGQVWPRFVPFDELVTRARGRLTGAGLTATDDDVNDLAGVVVRVFASGLCELSTHPPRWALTATDRPTASRVARAQLRAGDPAVANLWHENIRVDDPVLRSLVEKLDGTRNRKDLADEVLALAKAGKINAPPNLPRAAVEAEVNRILDRLAADALLVS